MCLEAIKINADALEFVKDQTFKICLKAIKQSPWALKHIKEQTEEICLEAVKKVGIALKFANKKTNEICLEAVKKDGIVLRYVDKQNDEICLEAVKRNGLALKYVENKTKEICINAAKNNIGALIYMEEAYLDDIIRDLNVYFFYGNYCVDNPVLVSFIDNNFNYYAVGMYSYDGLSIIDGLIDKILSINGEIDDFHYGECLCRLRDYGIIEDDCDEY